MWIIGTVFFIHFVVMYLLFKGMSVVCVAARNPVTRQ